MDTTNWKWFRYDEIFDIKKGKRLTSFDQEAGDIPYIGAIDSNNGVSAYIANDKYLHAGNTISVSYNGSIGQAYYQDQPFWATDDVNVFYPKYKFNKYIAFFILPLIEKEKYRFCYGRKWTSESMKSSKIPLPIMKDGTPDWQYMEDYVKNTIIPQLPEQARAVWEGKYDISPTQNKAFKIETSTWQWFEINALFNIITGKDLIYMNCVEGDYPVIGHSLENNGIVCTTQLLVDYPLQDHNKCISVAHIGNFYATIQKEDFYLGTRTKSLHIKYPDVSKYSLFFISVLINKEQYRFSYGRVGSDKLPTLKIKLPVTKDGTPDWQFMEDYIKSLPYSKNI